MGRFPNVLHIKMPMSTARTKRNHGILNFGSSLGGGGRAMVMASMMRLSSTSWRGGVGGKVLSGSGRT